MKKIYLKPKIVILKIELEQMIVSSGNLDMIPINPDTSGNPSSKERNGWEEGLW